MDVRIVVIDPVPEGDWSIESSGDRVKLKGIPPGSIWIYKAED